MKHTVNNLIEREIYWRFEDYFGTDILFRPGGNDYFRTDVRRVVANTTFLNFMKFINNMSDKSRDRFIYAALHKRINQEKELYLKLL